MLIIVCGLPGSGKTTLAEALSRRYGAVHISSDIIRKRMFAKPAYTDEEKTEVYLAMASEAGKSLREGRDVVADATFQREAERTRFEETARAAGTGCFVILCTLDEGKTRARMRNRGSGGPSDADFQVYLKLKASFEPISGPHLVLDTSRPTGERMSAVRDFIGR